MASSLISCPKLTGVVPLPSPMKTTSLMSPRLTGREVITKGSTSTRKKMKIVNKRKDDNRSNFNLVDQNMIVLRVRIKEMKMLETGAGGEETTPSNWTEWEKKYFVHYDEDVCEAIGQLQLFLMNTRPTLAVGLVALIATSVPLSTSFLIFNVIEILKKFF